jgi:glucose/arabinose dehydrogenase
MRNPSSIASSRLASLTRAAVLPAILATISGWGLAQEPPVARPSSTAVATPTIGVAPVLPNAGDISSITNAGDARLFLTIRTGQILIYQNGAIFPNTFLDISALTTTDGERGLESMAFHPNYASNGFFFIYHTDLSGDIQIVRYRVSVSDPNAADPTTRLVLLTIPHPVNSNHNGGQLQFGPDGYLYFGTGDGGAGNDPPCNSQNDNSPLGKMLRIDVDQNVNTSPFYGIPASNPHAMSAYPLNLTWAKGLRNPWRFSFDRMTGDLWIGDVGQDAWEEVDFQLQSSAGGQNYGWKIMEGNHCGADGSNNCPTNPAPPACMSPLFTAPLFEYSHADDCAVMGGYVYRGSKDSVLTGHYINGDLCSGHLRIESVIQTATLVGVQTFGQALDGEIWAGTGSGLYLITHPGQATAISVIPTPAVPQPVGTPLTFTATAAGGVAPLQYKFWRYGAASGWQMVQDYSTTNTYHWTPVAADAGQHDVAVWVRSAGSSAAFESVQDMGFFTVPSNVAITNLAGSPAPPQPAGTPIVWTASATGSPTPLQYRFWRYSAATGWLMVQDYSTSNTFSWTPSISQTGQWDIAVWVKFAGSPNAFDAVRDTGIFTITAPVTISALTPVPTPPQHAGTSITWTATATGNPTPLQYRFWRYTMSTGWVMVQDYSNSNMFTWVSGPAGQYDIAVWVKVAGSPNAFDGVLDTGFFTITP